MELPFDFYDGACNVFEEPTISDFPVILIRFSASTQPIVNQCHAWVLNIQSHDQTVYDKYWENIYIFSRFSGDHFQPISGSSYSHFETLGLGNYRGQAFTTGCNHNIPGYDPQRDENQCSTKTEILDLKQFLWRNTRDDDWTIKIPEYPFANHDKYAIFTIDIWSQIFI